MPYTVAMAEPETDPFPEFDDGLEAVALDDDLEDEISGFVPESFGFTWAFDFEKGDLMLSDQGRASVRSGVDAVREWCQHVLLTQRGQSPIIDPNVGTTLEELIGARTKSPYVIARIKQEVIQALELHDRIDSVKVTNVATEGTSAFVTVAITLDTGEEIDETLGL